MRGCLIILWFTPMLLFVGQDANGAQTIYSTKFEATAGYDANLDLAGQNGWVSLGSGGNGLIDGAIDNSRQAYIGFAPPAQGYTYLGLWHPLVIHPVASRATNVTFTVLMKIVDSTVENGHYDDFQWSAYNLRGERLFTVDFDNNNFYIYYALDGTNGFVDSGWSFNVGVSMELKFTMNFPSNRWSLSIGDAGIVTNKPIVTTSGAEPTLDSIAAEWIIRTAGAPGDNYMAFDDYKITASLVPPVAPQLSVLSQPGSGAPLLRLTGASNYLFAMERSTDLTDWIPVATNALANGAISIPDETAIGVPKRFYRARWVP